MVEWALNNYPLIFYLCLSTMYYSKIYNFLACIIFKQNVFNNRLFVYMFRPDVTVMVDRVLKSNHLYICLYLTHFQPSEWLGAQIQSSINLCIQLTFCCMRGWVLKSNCFLCIWLTFSHASGWALKSNRFLCIWLTFSHASEWLGAQIQSFCVYLTHPQPCEPP